MPIHILQLKILFSSDSDAPLFENGKLANSQIKNCLWLSPICNLSTKTVMIEYTYDSDISMNELIFELTFS